MKKTLLFLIFFFIALPAHCHEGKILNCFVSILPQSYFVERIGGGFVQTNVVVSPGQSPHTFEPTPKQLAGIVNADIYFTTGMPFEERLLKKISGVAPELKVVDTTEGIELIEIKKALNKDELNTQHNHKDTDPHVWLDPKLAVQQAEIITEALIGLRPQQSQAFQKNLCLLKAELQKLDRKIASMLMPYKGRSIFVFHPAYGYFARAYHLVQVAIEAEGKEPGAAYLKSILDQARMSQTKTVFSEVQYSQKSAQTIAEHIGAEVVMLDPLAKDYIDNMLHIARQVRKSFSNEE